MGFDYIRMMQEAEEARRQAAEKAAREAAEKAAKEAADRAAAADKAAADKAAADKAAAAALYAQQAVDQARAAPLPKYVPTPDVILQEETARIQEQFKPTPPPSQVPAEVSVNKISWTQYVPEATVKGGQVTDFGIGKAQILNRLIENDAPQGVISEFIDANPDLRYGETPKELTQENIDRYLSGEAGVQLGDKIIMEGIDSKGKTVTIIRDKDKVYDAAGLTSSKAVEIYNTKYGTNYDTNSPADAKREAYIELGILPKGTRLIGDGSAAAVREFNKEYGTNISNDFPYALPDIVKYTELHYTVYKESEKERTNFEQSLKDAPQYLQDAYKKGGVEAYNQAVVVYNAYIERMNASTIASFKKKLREMPQELQDAYNKGGLKAYNEAVKVYAMKVAGYNLASSYYYEAANKEFMDTLRKEWPALYRVYVSKGADAYNAVADELQKDNPDAAVLSKYLSPAELKVYNEPKMTAWDRYAILEQSGLLPKDSTKYSGERNDQPIISYGQDFGKAILKASPKEYLIMAAEMLVPGLYVGRHWNVLSTGEKALWIFIDALAVVPILRGGVAAARGVSTAGKLARLGAIGSALKGEALAQLRAPVDILFHPVGTAKALARDIRGAAELLLHPKRISNWVVTTTDGLVMLRIPKDIKTPQEALRLQEKITELARKSGGDIVLRMGGKEDFIEITLRRSPLMRESGGGYAHVSPDIAELLESARVEAALGKAAKEQGLFFAIEPSTEFLSGSAFGKGGLPVASEATETVMDVARYRASELVRIDKAPVKAMDFRHVKNMPDSEVAAAIQKYVADNKGIVYGSYNQYLKLHNAPRPNDIDLVFRNQSKSIDDILDIVKRKGYQVKRVPHGVAYLKDGKWVKIADISDIASHQARLPTGLSHRTLTRINGVLTETLGEQYLRQSMGAVAKDAKAGTRAKSVNQAAQEVREMLKKAGAQKMKSGMLITQRELKPTQKTFFSKEVDALTVELERKAGVGEYVLGVPKENMQHLWARYGPRAERFEIFLEKPLSWRQIAKLKAETLLEFAKAPFKEPVSVERRAGAVLAETMDTATAKFERDMGKFESAIRRAGNRNEADALRRIAKQVAAARRAPIVTSRLGRVLPDRIGQATIKELTPAQRRVMRPLTEILRTPAVRATGRLPERPVRDIPRPETPRVETPRLPREEPPRPPREEPPRPPREEPPRPPREEPPRPPREEPPRPPREEPPRPPREEPPRPPREELPRPPREELPRPPREEPPRRPLPKGSSDKEKREFIRTSSGATTYNMGKLNGKDVWHTKLDTGEHIVVYGPPPQGARIVADGIGSASKTTQRIGTKRDFKPFSQNHGAFRAFVRSSPTSKGAEITFKSEKRGKMYVTPLGGGATGFSRRPIRNRRR